MRWKLLLIASLAAATVGAGATLGIAYGLLGSVERLTASPLYVSGALIFPVAAITFASIFVYRHTARRRSLQAIMTVLLATILVLVATIAGLTYFAAPARTPETVPTQTTPQNVV